MTSACFTNFKIVGLSRVCTNPVSSYYAISAEVFIHHISRSYIVRMYTVATEISGTAINWWVCHHTNSAQTYDINI